MKKVILFIVATLMLGFSTLILAEMKMGVLDVNKVLADIPQVKTMQAEIKKNYDPRGQEVVKLQNALRSDIEKFRQTNGNLQGEALKKEQQKLIDENKKLQESRNNFQRDLIDAQNQALRPIVQQIEKIVSNIAKAQGLNLVLAKVSTVYSDAQLDITDKVIAEMVKLAPKPIAQPVVKKNTN